MSTGKPRAYLIRDYDEFLAVVDRARVDRRISYQRLGELVGTSRSHAGRWMRGDHVPMARVLFDLAHALGYDIALIPRKTQEDS